MTEIDNVPYLKRLSDNKEYPLAGGSMVIGRRDTCELVLSDESGVSRQHATIAIVKDDVIIEDLGSTNGVRLNGVKISSPTKVNADDTLIFDIHEYQLKIPQATPIEEDKIASKTIVADESSDEDLTQEQPVREEVAQEQAAQEQAAQEQAAQEQAAQEQAAQEQAAQEQAAQEQAAQEQAAQEKAAQEKAAQEKAAQEKAAQEKAAQEKAAQEKAAQDQAAQEKAAQEKAAQEKAAQKQAAQDQATVITASPVVSDPTPPAEQSKAKDSSPPPAAQPEKQPPAVEQPARKAAWIEERNAGATMFMPAVESSLDTEQIAPVEYNGEEPALIVIEGGDVGEAIKLSADKDTWRIGSSQSQDIVLSKEGVSESHATLSRDGGKWELRDLLSQNGIRVNGNKTLHSYLSNEDVIKFGPMKCLFVIPKGYKSAATAKATAAVPKNRNLLIASSVVFLIVIAALVAASFFNLIDFQSLLMAIKGR